MITTPSIHSSIDPVQGLAPTYVAGLSLPARDALRDRLRATLPAAADGSIELGARAWAVRGRA